VSNLPGALGGQTGWSRHFFDPIPTGDGTELRTLRDASVYILALPPAEAEREHWQIAMEFLISAAENGGIVMIARIAMLRALNAGKPDPEITPRRKRPSATGSLLFSSLLIVWGFIAWSKINCHRPPSYSPQDIKTKYC
jgi:hypothetical protein